MLLALWAGTFEDIRLHADGCALALMLAPEVRVGLTRWGGGQGG